MAVPSKTARDSQRGQVRAVPILKRLSAPDAEEATTVVAPLWSVHLDDSWGRELAAEGFFEFGLRHEDYGVAN